jgi:hypothetical protein
MEKEKVMDEFSSLPQEAQREVIDFISFLRKRYKNDISKKRVKRKPITEEPFVGMWQNRDDMRDSSDWVRKKREVEWGNPS